eukprot:2975973-Amphidinium_carterae.1
MSPRRQKSENFNSISSSTRRSGSQRRRGHNPPRPNTSRHQVPWLQKMHCQVELVNFIRMCRDHGQLNNGGKPMLCNGHHWELWRSQTSHLFTRPRS